MWNALLTRSIRKKPAENGLGDEMSDKTVDRKSPNYLKSEYAHGAYGNENSVTYERDLKLSGDKEGLKDNASWLQRRVMP